MTAPVLVGPSPVGGGPTPYLTSRELSVLRLAANGNTNRTIGRHRGVCEDTIKTQMRSILRKLHVDDRAQAVAVAICVGLISRDDVNIPGGLAYTLAATTREI